MAGKLVIISAPSGAGKTSIVQAVLRKNSNLMFSVSACSRKPRQGEIDGKDYYFFSSEEFKEKIAGNEFIEWEEVYPNHYYGTLRSEVEKIWEIGKHVIFDVDVKGGLNIKKQYPVISLAIFIKPPSIEILEERLHKRSTESEEQLKMRISKAIFEMNYADEFDLVIINENLQKAIEETERAINEFIENQHPQEQ